jgi:hypothetical protein
METLTLESFYIFFFDFRKINGRNFFSRNIHLQPNPTAAAAMPHDVKSLPPWVRRQESTFVAGSRGTMPGPCCPAPQQQAPTAVPHGGRTIFIFIFFIFKTLLTF